MKLRAAAIALAFALLVAAPAVAQMLGGGRVSDVRIEGTQRIDPGTVLSYMLVQPGDPFDTDVLDRSLKALFATGLFADVTLRRQGDVLIVNVVENPIINRIAFEGNQRIKNEDLAREVELRPRLVFTRTRVQQDVQRVVEVYRRSGRYGVTVEPKIIQQEQNRVDLVFEIDEGALTPVQAITFLGNRRFSDSTLRGVIQTKEYAFYRFLSNADVYDPDRLSFDRELLRRFYLESGYADFRVLSAVAELTPNREAFVVTFTVEEGQTYDFGTIGFNIALPRITEDELSALVVFREGDRYNSERVDQSIDAITERLGSLGYAFVDVRPRVERNRDEQTIDITFEIGEASKVFVERIDIVGNVRTLDRVIRREMNLVEGDAFNVSNMRRSERRIRNLGFFKRVEVTNAEGSAPDRTNIQIAVDEQPTGEISFGIGYSSVDALIGDVGIRERNLLGRGQDLRFGVRGSTSSSEFDISFTEPYFLDRDVAAGFDLFRVDREFRESSYSEARTGGSLRAAYDLSPDLRQSLNYTLKNTEIRNVKPEASRFVREQEGETVVSQIGQTLTYDKRDNRLDPRDGYFLQGTTELAGFGGDHQFLRLRGRSAYYVPIDNVWGLAFIGQAGYILGLDQDIPIAERFFIGGNAFRGFEKAGVGPRDVVSGDALGGNAFYVGTVELTFPNVMPDDLGVRTFVFSDIGSLWQVDATGPEVRDMNSVRATIGMGIEFVTAFGRIGVDFAHPLLKESFDQTELFRFSFGTQF